MALFRERHNLASSLRRDVRLLLPSDPGPERLLECVRLFNQNARPAGGGRIDVDGWQEVYLSRPAVINPGAAAEAGTPPGMGAACFVENHAHMRQSAVSAGSPRSRKHHDTALRLLHGLAVRLGGSAWPEAPVLDQPIRVAVYTASPETGLREVYQVLAKYVPGLEPEAPGDLVAAGVRLWRTADRGFEAEFWPAGSTSMMDPPPPRAVGDLQFYRASLAAVVLRLPVPGRRCLPATARLLAQCALDLTVAVDGLCVDQLGFRVLDPADLVYGLIIDHVNRTELPWVVSPCRTRRRRAWAHQPSPGP